MAETLSDFSLGKKIQPKGMIQKVGIVGCGTVGQEITRVVSEYGIDVIFIDINDERVEEIKHEIAAKLDNIISNWGMTPGDKRSILSRIQGSSNFQDLHDCDVVIEAIHSSRRGTSLETRKEVFKQIEAVVSTDTIIASNTATLMISDLATILKHPERAIGMHFMQPFDKTEIIEVVKAIFTSEESFKQAEKFATMIGRKVIKLNESPGNVSTRMMVTVINEACDILMEGVASIKDIDEAMRQASGYHFGPFEMADRIGLDKVLKYMENLYAEFGDNKYKASPLIKRLVRANHTGRMSGKGFYNYIEGNPVSQSISFTEFN
ncbi:MAG: 3-hydroxyacyl-CoA dehydrogenase family protein [Bacteroidales bacterium]